MIAFKLTELAVSLNLNDSDLSDLFTKHAIRVVADSDNHKTFFYEDGSTIHLSPCLSFILCVEF